MPADYIGWGIGLAGLLVGEYRARKSSRQFDRLVAAAHGPSNLTKALGVDLAEDEVSALLDALPRRERALFKLHYVGGLPLSEVADIFAISVPRAAMILDVAARKLRAIAPIWYRGGAGDPNAMR